MGVEMAMIGSSLLGGAMQSSAADSAAKSQARSAKDANALQLQMFNQQRADQEPWRQTGMRALAGLENPDFQRSFSAQDFQNYKDPGYDFRLQEGQKAIDNAAASRGMGNSGATMKALAKYGQDYSSNEYNNMYNRFNNDQTTRFNRLSSLAGVGQTANNQLAQAGQNYANQASSNIIGAGNARAAGQVGQANAFNNALGQGMGSWMQYQLNQPKTAAPGLPIGQDASMSDFSKSWRTG